MIFNHREPHTVQHYDLSRGRSRSSPLTRMTPYSVHDKLQFQTLHPVSAGDEIFAHYGEEWFWSRGIDEYVEEGDGTMRYESMSALKAVGHCLTDINVSR